ncbi:MAG: DnaJ domain-containing protein [Pseudomonadota bacterium]
MATYYEALDLKPEASLDDVKASYRRLVKKLHPDSAPAGGDPDRFSRVHQAYRALLRQLTGRSADSTDPLSTGLMMTETAASSGPAWRFEGVSEVGRDVVYMIRASAFAVRTGLTVELPVKKEDACPRCLGAGYTLMPIFGGPHLHRANCPKCQGSGVVKKSTTVRVSMTPEMLRMGKVRLHDLGRYAPAKGERGDLIVEVLWDQEPPQRETRIYTA